MTRTIATIEARMTSSRLPGKVLMEAAGTPLLEHMVTRLRRAQSLDGIVVATTEHADSDPIEALARRLGVGCFRGSEKDVLGRVLGAARAAEADVIVETSGDCPLIDPAVVDRAVEHRRATDADYCSNTLAPPRYPRGFDVQVFPTAVLADVEARTADPADREHVTLFIYEHPERYRVEPLRSPHPEAVELRLTVDTAEDLEVVRNVFDALLPADFGLDEVVALAAARPELFAANAGVRQKPVR